MAHGLTPLIEGAIVVCAVPQRYGNQRGCQEHARRLPDPVPCFSEGKGDRHSGPPVILQRDPTPQLPNLVKVFVTYLA
jgi:hypothetical protein